MTVNWKGFGRKQCCSVVKFYAGNDLKDLEKITKDLNDNRWPSCKISIQTLTHTYL